MATTCEVYKNGDGTEGPFTFTFPYLKDADIKVTVDGDLKSITTHYTIETSPSVGIKFTSGNFPAAGTNNIRIYRDTDVDTAKAVYAAGSSIRASDLNSNQEQALYALQEEQSQEIVTADIRDKAITSAKLDTNIDIAGTLDVTGATTLDSTLTVAGDTTVASDIILKADNKHLAIKTAAGTNKFLVNSLTGNTTIYGYADIATNLTVAGTSTLAGVLNANGGIACDTDKFTVADSTGNTAIAGNLDVDGATTLDGTTVDGVLDVNGSATIDNVQVNGNEIDTTSGGLTIDSSSGTTTLDDKIILTHGAGSDPNDIRAANSTDGKGACGMDYLGLWTADDATFAVGMNPDNGLDYDGEYYSDGTNTYIDAYADKNINLRTTNTGSEVRIAKSAGGTGESGDELMIRGVADGAAELYYDGTKRVETSSTGSTLTGDTTVTGKTITSTLKLGGTDVTSSATELNLLDGKSFKTSSGTLDSTSDTEIPSSKVINARIVAVAEQIGGFVPIADKDNFPTSNPDPNGGVGTVVSISDAVGISVNSSGVGSLATRAGGSDAVVINGFPTSMRGGATIGTGGSTSTNANPYIIPSGVGLQVQTTAVAHTYTYHKVQATEQDVVELTDAIQDFQARYRIGTSNPGSNNQDGDLFYNTSTNKMLVYRGDSSAWTDIAATGNYFNATLTSVGAEGDTIPGGSATFNGTAKKFGISLTGDQVPSNAFQFTISLNGVIQKPNSGTSVPSEGFAWDSTNNWLIFADAVPASTPYFIVVSGSQVNITTVQDDEIDLNHLKHQTEGDILYYAASGVPSKLAKGTDGQVLKLASGLPSWATHTSGLANVVEDTTPQLGGNLDIQDKTITTSTTDGDIKLVPDGDGDIVVGTGAAAADIKVNGTQALNLKGTHSYILINSGADGQIQILPQGTGGVDLGGTTTKFGLGATEQKLTTHMSGAHINIEPAGTSGNIKVKSGANEDIEITPNGSGNIQLDGLAWPNAAGSANQVLRTNSSDTSVLEWATISGTTTFLGLTDTPSSFTAGKHLKVNSGGNALELTDAPSGTITALNNQAADRLTTIGATTTELDGEASLTFNDAATTGLISGRQITGRGFECPAEVSDDWTIAAGNNAMFPGPMTVATGKTVTVLR